MLASLLPAVAVACLLRTVLPLAVDDASADAAARGAEAGVAATAGQEPVAAPTPVVAASPPPSDELAAAVAPAAGPGPEPEADLRAEALLEVARELKDRRERLRAMERDVEAREVALTLVADRLDAQIRQLEGLKRDLEGLLGKLSEEEEARIERLARVYEAMKPGKAAAVFDSMELRLLVPLVKRMREARVAAIVEAMDPARARAMTLELARPRELPNVSLAASGNGPPPAIGPER